VGSVYVASASRPGECAFIPDEGYGTCSLIDSDVAVPFEVFQNDPYYSINKDQKLSVNCCVSPDLLCAVFVFRVIILGSGASVVQRREMRFEEIRVDAVFFTT
jgi:hypothetical protein